MLTEEAHHMFVGESGVQRIVMRTAELMKQAKNEDVRPLGGIDLPTLQKYLNLWFSLSSDLFGGEISSNAADFFAAGLKGRYKEGQYEEHKALDAQYKMAVLESGKLIEKDVPLRSAMNEVLRDNYVEDCQRAVDKWNRTIEKSGLTTDFRFSLPNRRFHRHQGIYAGMWFDPQGNPMDEKAFNAKKDEWLPSEADIAYIESLMNPVYEAGKIAQWLAPPTRGINGNPFEYEYVRL
jgi:benzoyl-CoA 2,3-dioxygenase component B